MMKILIDNGHGIDTAGKRSPDGKFLEYKYTREIAELVVAELKRKGYDAERIVTEQSDVSLYERCKRVNAICKSLGSSNVCLVSIHVNASANPGWDKASYWSAWTSVGQTKGDELADCLYEAAKEVFQGKRISSDMSDGDPDMESNFYILKHTNCAACLTENFFQNNESDIAYLQSEEGMRAVVNCHVNGIINYVNKD